MVLIAARRMSMRSLSNIVFIRDMDTSKTLELLGAAALPVPPSSANQTLAGVKHR